MRQFEKNRNPGDHERKETGQKLSSEPRINFRGADDTGVGPDFVEMSLGAGYDVVRDMREDLRVGDTR